MDYYQPFSLACQKVSHGLSGLYQIDWNGQAREGGRCCEVTGITVVPSPSLQSHRIGSNAGTLLHSECFTANPRILPERECLDCRSGGSHGKTRGNLSGGMPQVIERLVSDQSTGRSRDTMSARVQWSLCGHTPFLVSAFWTSLYPSGKRDAPQALSGRAFVYEKEQEWKQSPTRRHV